MSEVIVFAVAAIIVLSGAIGVVISRNPVHSALFLIQTLFGVAVLFVLQEAHFLAAVQIVVYAGAIVILFLFVIMLLGVDTADDWSVEPIAGQRPLTVIVGAALAGFGLALVVVASDALTGAVRSGGDGTLNERALDNGFTDIERIGRVLFSDYALSFEITAALLTVAVIGAVVLTRRQLRGELLEDLEAASMDLPPAAPATPGESNGPGAPATPGNNNGPGAPATPDESNVSGAPAAPGNNNGPGAPATPGESRAR
ncbi:MAG: NADH-quinone oxidoreductase subunit J [Acidimicrobiaceae bacterium]|nr:NADH-quinone oxidoreductase subunit J [Acidimicrobiaceae bacterium]MXW75301.1 NADH-quinone oxidoreductase subunit J [Acidimicrobiaceae bacterium]MYC42702.1 NADH-quinone oxidoreductase subunit J [Acidimicrobiaceae bacterium]MYD07170.1 NADH-quinone oxidoreductase subunit J [Acidimicrobiaceae bacterium]MYH87673.1 NADH-quinone oxidoreductase subunit J [Acidimicrobiaceae bacterium]